jgi:hypothetical protein
MQQLQVLWEFSVRILCGGLRDDFFRTYSIIIHGQIALLCDTYYQRLLSSSYFLRLVVRLVQSWLLRSLPFQAVLHTYPRVGALSQLVHRMYITSISSLRNYFLKTHRYARTLVSSVG